MTKAEIIKEIVNQTGIEKDAVAITVEAIMVTIKTSITKGENVYLRGFATFLLKKRAEYSSWNCDAIRFSRNLV